MTGHMVYEIQVQEQLDSHWAGWFDGLALSHGEDNTSILRGPLVDQAALYGLLDKTRDLGLTLISVRRIVPSQATCPRQSTPEEGPRIRCATRW